MCQLLCSENPCNRVSNWKAQVIVLWTCMKCQTSKVGLPEKPAQRPCLSSITRSLDPNAFSFPRARGSMEKLWGPALLALNLQNVRVLSKFLISLSLSFLIYKKGMITSMVRGLLWGLNGSHPNPNYSSATCSCGDAPPPTPSLPVPPYQVKKSWALKGNRRGSSKEGVSKCPT